jgi:ribonuclease HI
MKKVTCTIFTDASFFPNTNKGAYACWIELQGKTYKHAKPFKEQIQDNNEAELKAIINALENLKWTPTTTIIKKVRIITDSKLAIDLFYGFKVATKYIQLVEKLSQYNEYFEKIELLHIHSHTKINSKKTYVNSWCDRQAKNAVKYSWAMA